MSSNYNTISDRRKEDILKDIEKRKKGKTPPVQGCLLLFILPPLLFILTLIS
jgi:hypothetical protein